MRNLIVALFLIGSTAFAQERRDNKDFDADKMHEKLVEKLDLTEKQAQEVKAAQRLHFDAVKQFKESSREEMSEMREQMNTQMRSILNKEQYGKYMEIQGERRQKMKMKSKKGKHGKKSMHHDTHRGAKS